MPRQLGDLDRAAPVAMGDGLYAMQGEGRAGSQVVRLWDVETGTVRVWSYPPGHRRRPDGVLYVSRTELAVIALAPDDPSVILRIDLSVAPLE